jgi:hypothetical protein
MFFYQIINNPDTLSIPVFVEKACLINHGLFSSLGPKGPGELLPSLGIRRRSPSYVVSFFKDLLL